MAGLGCPPDIQVEMRAGWSCSVCVGVGCHGQAPPRVWLPQSHLGSLGPRRGPAGSLSLSPWLADSRLHPVSPHGRLCPKPLVSQGHQSDWIRTHLAASFYHIHLQIQPHCEVLRVRNSTYGFGGTPLSPPQNVDTQLPGSTWARGLARRRRGLDMGGVTRAG